MLINLEKNLKSIEPPQQLETKMSTQEMNEIKSQLSKSVEQINDLCDEIVLTSKQDPKELVKSVSKMVEVTKSMVDSSNKISKVISENKGKQRMVTSSNDLMKNVISLVKNSKTANLEPKSNYEMSMAYASLNNLSSKVVECLEGKKNSYFSLCFILFFKKKYHLDFMT